MSSTWLHFIYKSVALCMPQAQASMVAASERNIALCDVLDRDASVSTAMPMEDGPEEGQHTSSALQEEQQARLQAEADAQDKADRLRVAQEQLAEYASQKEKDAASLLELAEAVTRAFTAGDLVSSSSSQQDALLDQLSKLRQAVAEQAEEAKAFAAQQKADVESLKRSFHQADLPTVSEDVEMKRPREGHKESEEALEDDSLGSTMESPSTSTQGGDVVMSNGHHHAAAEDHTTRFVERAKYIPVRLNQDERRLLRLLEAALSVSDYTDKVDILAHRSKSQRVHTQIRDICAILLGLLVAHNYKTGQELVRDRNFKDNAQFFQDVFEVGRRYKIMNPDRMRATAGKLLYMLMDSANPDIQELLEFKCVKPLQTVYTVLAECNGLKLLEDPLLHTATAEIVAGDRPRYEVQRDIKVKEKAREVLVKRYKSSRLGEEDILNCIYSISDNNSFLLFNRDPIDRMIHYFTTYFSPTSIEPGYSLAIQGGREGARLTHNHERQYNYVLQSLTLWREISTEMFRLWYLSEADMLREGNLYRLVDTGQGLNRVQSAPAVSRAIHAILSRCQARIGSWVGSSVVHLGDHNVPNALMFIDKYTQVPRILNPIVLVLEELPRLYRDEKLRSYIDDAFGGVEQCRKYIMVDFCRHAFDGSGADNFFDAGSCIDGRLTSAWNWCSKIDKKPYYPIFKVAGFVGFDGDFKN